MAGTYAWSRTTRPVRLVPYDWSRTTSPALLVPHSWSRKTLPEARLNSSGLAAGCETREPAPSLGSQPYLPAMSEWSEGNRILSEFGLGLLRDRVWSWQGSRLVEAGIALGRGRDRR